MLDELLRSCNDIKLIKHGRPENVGMSIISQSDPDVNNRIRLYSYTNGGAMANSEQLPVSTVCTESFLLLIVKWVMMLSVELSIAGYRSAIMSLCSLALIITA